MSTHLPAIHVVGDSISIQYGPYLERALCGRISYSRKDGKPGDLDRPAGANGGDSSRVLEYLSALMDHYDCLVLNCGLHDIKRTDPDNRIQVPVDAYVENLERIVRESRRIADRLVWIRTTPVDDAQHNDRPISFRRHAADLARYNAAADAVMVPASLGVIDLYTFTAPLLPEGYCDHVHFKEVIRQLHGAFIAGHLIAWLAPGTAAG